MSGFLSRLLHRAGIANAAGEEISLLRYRSPARFEPSGPEPDALEGKRREQFFYACSFSHCIRCPRIHGGLGRHTRHDAVGSTRNPGFCGRESEAIPRGPPVPAPGSSIDFNAEPRRPMEAAAVPDHPILMPDRRSRFEGHSPERPASSASITAPLVLPPILPPKAAGNADQRPLTSHSQPVRQRKVPPKDLLPPKTSQLPPKASQPSVSAPGIRRVETPPAPNVPSPQQTEPQSETIIQIARVEIVASQSEPRRTVAPVSRKPTTSLADYLARRRR